MLAKRQPRHLLYGISPRARKAFPRLAATDASSTLQSWGARAKGRLPSPATCVSYQTEDVHAYSP